MSAPSRPKWILALAIILSLFAIGTLVYWITFYTVGLVAASNAPGYLEHENSFPAADGYIVICIIVCVIGLLRRRSWGVLFGLMAGSAIIFLGLMDTLYPFQQGVFREFSFGAVETFLICATCLALGPATIIYLWRNRAYFDKP
ncbi:hypothetical protein HZA56_21880 [Candidatus Poribacteria bacterium]|nr:hypothetical protein [Candidatus Poribacteria bacterium]